MSKTIEYKLEQLPQTASALITVAGNRKIWLFTGQMGAGKTTLIKEICSQLGVVSGMSSPTFSLVNEYATPSGKPVYHFDLYRLKNKNELSGIGFAEYIDSGNYCLIEWPEMVAEVIDDAFTIDISLRGELRTLLHN